MSIETIETELSEDARSLLQEIKDCDGAEIPRPWWEDAQELVDVGLITLSGARGPGNSWKRGELSDTYTG